MQFVFCGLFCDEQGTKPSSVSFCKADKNKNLNRLRLMPYLMEDEGNWKTLHKFLRWFGCYSLESAPVCDHILRRKVSYFISLSA